MKITPTDKRILFDFLSNFEIQNSEWGKDFLNRIKNDNPEERKNLYHNEKLLCDWEQ
jgi:hypothetical protein